MTAAERSRHYRRLLTDAAFESETIAELSLALTCVEIAHDGGLLRRDDLAAVLAVHRAQYARIETARRAQAFEEAMQAVLPRERACPDLGRVSLPRARIRRPHGSARRFGMQDDSFEKIEQAIRDAKSYDELSAAIARTIALGRTWVISREQGRALYGLAREKFVALDPAADCPLVLEEGAPGDPWKRGFESQN